MTVNVDALPNHALSDVSPEIPVDLISIRDLHMQPAPTWDKKFVSYSNTAVFRHSTPKLLNKDGFQSSITLWNPGRQVIMDNAKPKNELCKTRSLTTNNPRKKKVSTASAKRTPPPHPSFSLWILKLIETFKASTIECKVEWYNLKLRSRKMEYQGVSDFLENEDNG